MVLGILEKKENQQIEHFWSLVISGSWVQAGIWRVVDERVEVVVEGGVGSWQEGNVESLVAASDGSLSAAAASLVPEENIPEPDKVVFGLLPSWVEQGSIRRERLDILKKLSEELELAPAGFVVIPEAIVHFLKSKEGVPLNAILVGIMDDAIDVSLVQGGKIMGTENVARSISLGPDLAEGLARLPTLSQYPSRILLYNHKVGNLDDARQNLLEMEWKDAKISFLHEPKVEVLPENVCLSAVSLAGGAEVGHATTVILPEDEDEDIPDDEKHEEPDETVGEEARSSEKELETVNAEDLGFLQGVDVARTHSLRDTLPLETDAGSPETRHVYALKEEDRVGSGDAVARPSPKEAVNIFASFTKILSFPFVVMGKLLSQVTKKGTVGFGIIGLLGVLAIGMVLYWYLPKAEVVIYVAPKKLSKTINFSIDPKITVIDQANKRIPGSLKEIEVAGDKTAAATGTKTVGDRAKGQVIIYHVGPPLRLKSGTTLVGPNNLKFTLDQEVPIATGTGGILNSSPSKTQAAVTALNIGAEYNLAQGTEFTIGNFSKTDFVAQNDSVFSGGTSRAVSAVSENDRIGLDKDLSQELLQKGIEDLRKGLSRDEVLIEGSAVVVPASKSFSHKAGEETNTLKLSIEGKVTSLIVPQIAFDSLVRSSLEGDIPSGYTLRSDQIEVSYKLNEDKKDTSGTVVKKDKLEKAQPATEVKDFVAEVRVNLLPKTNPDDLAKAISGRNTNGAEEYLATTPGYVRAAINFDPPLPGNILPRVSKNITIEVRSE